MSFVVSEYDLETGAIGMTWAYSTAEGLELNIRPSVGYVDGRFDPSIYYVHDGEPTERPASPVTIDGRTLSNVPAGSALWIDGEQYEAEGEVELDFVMPRTYKLRVVCFPYMDWEYDLVML